jgi:anti-sigma-K factor RskA
VSEHDAYLELAALYAVGALPELERARFEAHLAEGCAECEAELAALRPAVDALAAVVEPAPPSTDLRARVLALAAPPPAPARDERAAPPRRASRWPLFAAAASVLIAALLGAQVVSLQNSLREAQAQALDLGRALAAEQETLQKVRAELDESRAAQQVLTAQVATLEATARVLTAPSTRTVALAGQGPGASARARAFLSPDTRTLILYAYDLPALPADRTYQAWVIPGKVPVPIGVFDPEVSGFARHEAVEVTGLEAPVTVAVTIEPRGGLPQPSGPIVLAGR